MRTRTKTRTRTRIRATTFLPVNTFDRRRRDAELRIKWHVLLFQPTMKNIYVKLKDEIRGSIKMEKPVVFYQQDKENETANIEAS